MGKYIILGDSQNIGQKMIYKGLYRSEPCPYAEMYHTSIMPLCIKYIGEEERLGVTLESISLAELLCLTKFFKENCHPDFELIYFTETPDNLPNTLFYGIDVAGVGGYSILGEEVFWKSKNTDNQIINGVREHFITFLNGYNLFESQVDANEFIKALNQHKQYFESDEWKAQYIYKVET